ncbi:MAG: hypothetical protein AAGD06_28285, partial [Acidobacteriota bacterium]
RIPLLDDAEREGPESFTALLKDPVGGATLGNSRAELTLLDDDLVPFECVPDDTTACLGDGQFEVRVEWRDPRGERGFAKVAPVGSDRSGLFWFFDGDNWEMLIKVLDGCGVNDRQWVLLAATTDLGFTATVIDSRSAVLRRYVNPLGAPAPATTDTDAFPCP